MIALGAALERGGCGRALEGGEKWLGFCEASTRGRELEMFCSCCVLSACYFRCWMDAWYLLRLLCVLIEWYGWRVGILPPLSSPRCGLCLAQIFAFAGAVVRRPCT